MKELNFEQMAQIEGGDRTTACVAMTVGFAMIFGAVSGGAGVFVGGALGAAACRYA